MGSWAWYRSQRGRDLTSQGPLQQYLSRACPGMAEGFHHRFNHTTGSSDKFVVMRQVWVKPGGQSMSQDTDHQSWPQSRGTAMTEGGGTSAQNLLAAQTGTEQPGQSSTRAPEPMGRGCGWRPWVRLVRVIKIYQCNSGPSRSLH